MSKKQNNVLFLSKSERMKITKERNISLLKAYDEAKLNRKGAEFLREKAKELEMQESSLRILLLNFRKNHKEITQEQN